MEYFKINLEAPTQNFRSSGGNWIYVITHNDSIYIKVLYIFGLFFSTLMSIMYIKLILMKIRNIKNPEKNSSYCIFSVHILYLTIFTLTFVSILNLL